MRKLALVISGACFQASFNYLCDGNYEMFAAGILFAVLNLHTGLKSDAM